MLAAGAELAPEGCSRLINQEVLRSRQGHLAGAVEVSRELEDELSFGLGLREIDHVVGGAHGSLGKRSLHDYVDEGVLPPIVRGVVGCPNGALRAIEAPVQVGAGLRRAGGAALLRKAGDDEILLDNDSLSALGGWLAT